MEIGTPREVEDYLAACSAEMTAPRDGELGAPVTRGARTAGDRPGAAPAEPRPPCAGVGTRSSQPCANWVAWRRPRW